MNLKILFFFCWYFFQITYSSSQSPKNFQRLLVEVKELSKENQGQLIANYVTRNSFPLLEDDSVIFLVNSTVEPQILGDFNGFMNKRYVTDSSLSYMTKIGLSDWYYYKRQFEPQSVVNYNFLLGEKTILDTLNSSRRQSFGSLYSLFKMPDAKSYPSYKSYQLEGNLLKDSIFSEIQQHSRTLHVYLPPDYEQNHSLPAIYFHDGSFHISEMQAHKIIDSLIVNNIITPVIAVFDDPVIRGKEYREDSAFSSYVENELFQTLESKYSISLDADDNAAIGFSRGGMSALYLSRLNHRFSKIGAFSPAIYPKSIPAFTKELESSSQKSAHYFITKSAYDYIWADDASKLKDYFSRIDVQLSYTEIPMGHNIQSWRTLLDDMLIGFYSID